MDLLMVNGERFVVPERLDLDGLGADIVEAARAGGGLVDVSSGQDRTRCVLITPNSTVLLERIPTGRGVPDGRESDRAASDWSLPDWPNDDLSDLL